MEGKGFNMGEALNIMDCELDYIAGVVKEDGILIEKHKALTRLGLKYGVKNYRRPGRRELYKIVLRGSNAINWAKIVKPLHPVKFFLLYTLLHTPSHKYNHSVHPSNPPPKPAH